MGNLTGLLWFSGMDPESIMQNFSVAADMVGEAGAEIVQREVEDSQEKMRKIINDGGINKTAKGGPRRISNKMYDSVVQADIRVNARDRIQGKIGYAEDTPEWTKWQEFGTARGIPEMLAFVTAQEELVAKLSGTYASGDWVADVFKRYM